MPNATLRANARTLPCRRRPVAPALRRRLEASLENLIGLLDELDGDPDLEDGHDREGDPAERGLADADGLAEQTGGEPSLGATLDIDQRVAWGRQRFTWTVDSEATGTVEDVERVKSYDARVADRAAAIAARNQAREIIRRRRAAAHA
ncbi:MAG: hypothetical protein KGM15_12030 [Pseudomonadota bacterium]|nr:hypothetical protein [Pseudomonadota bacterium]